MLIEHYLSVAELDAAAHRRPADQPGALLRAASAASRFYQKHASDGFPDEFKAIRIREKSGTDRYLYIEDERGLVAAVQIGVLELHLWGCHIDEVEKPDRLVFDFDPDEDLDFGHVHAGRQGHARVLEGDRARNRFRW